MRHPELEEEDFRLHYQPIVCCRTDGTMEVVALEALLRWVHPTRGLLSADGFLTLARQTQSLCWLGHWVVYKACCHLQEWSGRGFRGAVSVNMVASELTLDLVDTVRLCLSDFNLPGRRLLIEVALPEEGAEETAEQRVALRQLREEGVHLLLEDSGVGRIARATQPDSLYSGIKIARIPASPESLEALFLRELVEISRERQRLVIATRVETSVQRDLLLGLGCRVMQGFYLGEPMPADEDPFRPRYPAVAGRVPAGRQV